MKAQEKKNRCGIFTSGSAWCSFPLLVTGEGGPGLQGLQQTEHKNAMSEYQGGRAQHDFSLAWLEAA